jgi:hypothetical protein
MSQSNILRYEVRIVPRMACAADKSKYNADYLPEQEIEAGNYFRTLTERYQAFNFSNPSPLVKQGMGQFYTITLTTILDNDSVQRQD